MPCYNPKGWYMSVGFKPNGKKLLTRHPQDRPCEYVLLPCNTCSGCRMAYAQQWAIRLHHEATLDPGNNAFLTLTYSDEHLPENSSLVKRDTQLFLKRLRNKGPKFRFFLCGEYGEKTKRPHYHAVILGYSFPDKKFYKESKTGFPMYKSKLLADAWQDQGFSDIGSVTPTSTAYTARYILKKQTGLAAVHHYNKIDKDTGEISEEREPEFTKMSLQPGLGTPWIEKFHTDVYPEDLVIMSGKRYRPPRHYDTWLKKHLPNLHETVIENRRNYAKENVDNPNNTPERLLVRKTVQDARQRNLTRELTP